MKFNFYVALTLMAFVFATQSQDDLRGDRVGWARLKTPSEWWKRHAEADPVLMKFLRANTSLNLDLKWNEADVENLHDMNCYPFLFSQGVETVASAKGRTNVAEYIRRGGFLLIDACIDDSVTPDPDVFFARQIQWLAESLPEARVLPLPSDHLIYRCYFQISEGKPPHTHTSWSQRDDPRWTKHGLYEIKIGSRTAGVITLSGLQCGWARVGSPPALNHDIACMKMLVNIYIFAMLHG
ncbi:MAG: DUF4159 domain-containing protein [Verrucomicrobiota bacterium]